MPDNYSPIVPPPLTQDPEISTARTVVIKAPGNKEVRFDLNKVLAAVGLVLTATIFLVAGMWLWLQTLEQRVEGLEDELNTVRVTKVSSTSAQEVSTKSATPSAY